MKLFEIGDGLKLIKLPSSYCASREEDGSLRIYNSSNVDIIIRLTIRPVAPKNYLSTTKVSDTTIEGIGLEIQNTYKDYSTYIIETVYLKNLIAITITTSANFEKNNMNIVASVKSDMETAIKTVSSVSTENAAIFEPRLENIVEIRRRASEILNIAERELEEYHKSNKTLIHIQKLLDNNVFNTDQTYELQSLGLALGDYLQYKNEDFHWIVIRDTYGRDYCLQFQNFGLTVSPLALIYKQIEKGQDIDIVDLLSALVEQMETIAES